MTIVRMSDLSSSDVALLGNNVRSRRARPRPKRRRFIAAINRSLARMNERVARLYSQFGLDS